MLVSCFVRKFAKEMQKQIDAVPTAVMKGLMSWDWPGNIRELENFIERAVLLTKGRSLASAPLAELRKTSTNRPHDDLHEMKQVAQQDTESESDKSSVTDKYVRSSATKSYRHLPRARGAWVVWMVLPRVWE